MGSIRCGKLAYLCLEEAQAVATELLLPGEKVEGTEGHVVDEVGVGGGEEVH